MQADQDPVYQVLARKYRPATFADLIGQEAMVRTLRNAFAADRIAQAFMLTGIRGTGKTTTARIVAKGLNCIGPDGTGGPTTDPCGVCDNCVAITQGRHVDVIEMDAASNTGVQNIRDAIIDTVSYRAATARFKIFIIDEVHMLSTSAFNALLKTLEEPPGHVKFLFATTEIRKVPVTVLSRCQRFDLRRIEPEVMIAHLARVAGLEGAAISGDALALITRAAEGSVRDAISLLDQAISHGAGETGVEQVRAMLGLADRGRVLDLFEAILRGEAARALDELGAQYADGADPVAVLRDLAEITHWISVIAIAPDAAEDPTIGPDERLRGRALAEALPMRVLTRMWQMLLKALEEVRLAPNPMMAAEMAVIRLTHVADLPSPGDLVRRLVETPGAGGGAAAGGSAGGGARSPSGPQSGTSHAASPVGPAAGAAPLAGAARSATPSATPAATPAGTGSRAVVAARNFPDPRSDPALGSSFDSIVALIAQSRDIRLLLEVKAALRPVSCSPGRLEVEVTDDAPRDLLPRLGRFLQAATGHRWAISIATGGGAPTIAERDGAARAAIEAEVSQHPLVQTVLARFPGARIAEVRSHADMAQAAAETALGDIPEEAEDWDPFEDD